MANPKIEVEETNLEDLILLGEDKKIPIEIEFPKTDGTTIKTKALVKQLTLKEMNDLQINQSRLVETNVEVLEKALFKTTGDNFTREEILSLPIGVVNAISEKIMELSGMNMDYSKRLADF